MAMNTMVTNSNVAALIPEEYSKVIFGSMPENSSILTHGLRLPDASRSKMRIPVWESLPQSFFRSSGALMQTSNFSWKNVYANMVNLDCYVPITEEDLEDADYDIFGNAIPRIAESMGQLVDQAVIDGTNKPEEWDFDSILTGATAAGNVVSLAAIVGASGDFYDATLGEAGHISKVENDGFLVNGHLAAVSVKSKMRGLRGDDGHPVWSMSHTNGVDRELFNGAEIKYPRNGGIPASCLMVSGDFNCVAYSLRKQLTYKIFTESVVSDSAGRVVYNVAQQGMAVLRVTMRIGVALINPPNRQNENNTTRYHHAVLIP